MNLGLKKLINPNTLGRRLKHMFNKITLLLVILGAVNIGLVTLLHVDLISVIFGELSRIISVLVGLSGFYMLVTTYTTLLKKTAH